MEGLTDKKKDAVRKRLFLTGATGFFGRSILRFLDGLETAGCNPWHVTAMTRSRNAFLIRYPEFQNLDWLSFHEGDILDGPKAFPITHHFTHVLHAAADSTNGPQMPLLERFDQIVTGTRNALDFALVSGAKRFLLTSSGGVYGAQPSDMHRIPEDYHGIPDSLIARNAYSVAKRTAEHLCALYAVQSSLEVVVARCFAFVGPDLPLSAHFAIGNFIRDAMAGSQIVVNGDGTPLRSYLYQDDLAEWLLTMIEKASSGQAYNVGSDHAVSILELAERIQILLASDKAVKVLKDPSASSIRSRYIPSIEKARVELNLEIKTSLDDAIQKTAQALTMKEGLHVPAV